MELHTIKIFMLNDAGKLQSIIGYSGHIPGAGWLAVMEVTDWKAERTQLLDPQAYFKLMKGQAEQEAKKP